MALWAAASSMLAGPVAAAAEVTLVSSFITASSDSAAGAITSLPRTHEDLHLTKKHFMLSRSPVLSGTLHVSPDGLVFAARRETLTISAAQMRNVFIEATRAQLDYEDGGSTKTVYFEEASIWKRLRGGRAFEISTSLSTVMNANGHASPSTKMKGLLHALFSPSPFAAPVAPPERTQSNEIVRRRGFFYEAGLGLGIVRDSLSTYTVDTHWGFVFHGSGGLFVNPHLGFGVRLLMQTDEIDPAAALFGVDAEYWATDRFLIGTTLGALGSYSSESVGIAARLGMGLPLPRTTSAMAAAELLMDAQGRVVGFSLHLGGPGFHRRRPASGD